MGEPQSRTLMKLEAADNHHLHWPSSLALADQLLHHYLSLGGENLVWYASALACMAEPVSARLRAVVHLHER